MPSPNHQMRASLSSTGAALRRGNLKISDPIPFGDSEGMFVGSSNLSANYPSGHQPSDDTWSRQMTPPPGFHSRHVSDVPSHYVARVSAGPSIIPSTMSSIPSKSSLSQKKPSGLRAAISRMFASKRHRSVPSQTSEYHYVDSPLPPDPAGQSQPRQRLDSAPALSSGIVTRGTALTSHAVTCQQPDAVEPTLPSPPRRGRRNTLPSLVFNNKESGLQPQASHYRPHTSSHHKGRSEGDYVSDVQIKRRSRSADALNDLVRQGVGELSSSRDRAGQIAYWRNSAIMNPVPVYSGQSIAVDPVHVLRPATAGEDSERDLARVHPLQAFDFGLDDVASRDETTLEQRINTLEIKLYDFEYAIAKLQGNNIAKPVLDSKPLAKPAVHEDCQDSSADATFSSSSTPDLSYLSSPETVHDMTFLSSPGDSPVLSPDPEEGFRPQRASKATTTTIRPVAVRHRSAMDSRETSPSSIRIPIDKLQALMELIKDEQAARQKLEEQVMQLQKDMDSFRTPVYATIREAYPTPSPTTVHNSPNSPRKKTLHRTQPFQMCNPPQEVSRFSGTEDSDEEGFEDVYETPQESRNKFETSTSRNSPRMVAT